MDEAVPDGRIRVKNDMRGSEYTTIEVSGGGSYYTLKAGERTLMPPGTRTLNFTLQEENHTRYYQVECPEITGKGISINLIDVHVGRIAGGCRLVGANKD